MYRKRTLYSSLNLSILSLNSLCSSAICTVCHGGKNFLACSPGCGTAFRLSSWRDIILDYETRYNGKAKWGLFHASFLFPNCWLFFHRCFLDSPATFSNFIGLAHSLVFFTHLGFAKADGKTRSVVRFFATEAMNYKGLVDPKTSRSATCYLSRFKFSLCSGHIVLWPMTEGKKWMQNLPAFPVALKQTFQSSWHFRFPPVTKVFLLHWNENHILAFKVVRTVSDGTHNKCR